MAYKITYNVFDDKVVRYAKDEIALAAEILDMERDVGKICYNVAITEADMSETARTKGTYENLQNIERWSKILQQDIERQTKANKKTK
jgi:hypothetical protein